MTPWLITAGLAGLVALLVWLLFRDQQDKGALKEKAKGLTDVVKETRKQADVAVELRTDSDVVSSLRAKAAAKRKR